MAQVICEVSYLLPTTRIQRTVHVRVTPAYFNGITMHAQPHYQYHQLNSWHTHSITAFVAQLMERRTRIARSSRARFSPKALELHFSQLVSVGFRKFLHLEKILLIHFLSYIGRFYQVTFALPSESWQLDDNGQSVSLAIRRSRWFDSHLVYSEFFTVIYIPKHNDVVKILIMLLVMVPRDRHTNVASRSPVWHWLCTHLILTPWELLCYWY